MEQSIIIISIVSVVVIIIFLIYYFSPKTTILRRLKKLRFSKIGSLQNHNYSKVEGNALNVNQPLIAPLSQRECVFYQILIEKKVGSGKNSHWKTVVDEEKIQDFLVEQTGERLIIFPKQNPENYYAYLVSDKKANSGTFNDPTPEFQSLLDNYGIESTGLFGFNKQIRYRESIIEIGERITVAGYVKWIELEQPVSDYNYSRVATLVAKDKNKILITDTTEALKPKYGR